jgi:hypothetical protein
VREPQLHEVRAADDEGPLQLGGFNALGFEQALQAQQDRAHLRGQLLRPRRRRYAPRGPHEQLVAGRLAQPAQRVGERRLAQPEPLGRPRDVPFAEEHVEGAELSELEVFGGHQAPYHASRE